MWHMCQILPLDPNLIEPYFIICLSLKATTAKCWTRLGKLVKFVGQTAVHAVYHMEKRSPDLALGVFKECEDLMCDRLSSIVLHMSRNKSTILGIKREIKSAGAQQSWSQHVLLPDAITEGFVHPSRDILLFSYLGSMCFFYMCIPIGRRSWPQFRPASSVPLYIPAVFSESLQIFKKPMVGILALS